MTFGVLFNVSPIILVHAMCALFALLLGMYQLVTMKGTRPHRVLGYFWCGLMGGVAVSSFWIRTIDQFLGFSFIHLLSIVVAIGLPLAVLAARRGDILRHQRMMKGMYLGGLIVAGIFTLAPGRILGRFLIGW